MDILNFLNQINISLLDFNVDLLIVLLVIASGFFQRKYLSEIKVSSAYKTLLISGVFVALYIVLTCDFTSWECVKPCLKTALISYTMATSFYELIVKYFIDKFSDKKLA